MKQGSFANRINITTCDKLELVLFAVRFGFRLRLVPVTVAHYLIELAETKNANPAFFRKHYQKPDLLANVYLTHLNRFVEYLLQLPRNRLFNTKNKIKKKITKLFLNKKIDLFIKNTEKLN